AGGDALQDQARALVDDPGDPVELGLAGRRAAVPRGQVAVVAFLVAGRLDDAVAANLRPADLGAAVAAPDVAVVASLAGFQDSVAARGRGARSRARIPLERVAVVALLERIEGAVTTRVRR